MTQTRCWERLISMGARKLRGPTRHNSGGCSSLLFNAKSFAVSWIPTAVYWKIAHTHTHTEQRLHMVAVRQMTSRRTTSVELKWQRGGWRRHGGRGEGACSNPLASSSWYLYITTPICSAQVTNMWLWILYAAGFAAVRGKSHSKHDEKWHQATAKKQTKKKWSKNILQVWFKKKKKQLMYLLLNGTEFDRIPMNTDIQTPNHSLIHFSGACGNCYSQSILRLPRIAWGFEWRHAFSLWFLVNGGESV